MSKLAALAGYLMRFALLTRVFGILRHSHKNKRGWDVNATDVKRAVVYIDGFNLYNGINDTGKQFLKWLDIQNLSESVIVADLNILRAADSDIHVNADLVYVKYFTSIIKSGEDQADRQKKYLRVLSTFKKMKFFYGHFLKLTRKCPECKAYYEGYEEKKTDVNIASELMEDAYEDRFDFAYVVSADSDLSLPIKKVINRGKRVVMVFPPNRKSKELKSIASGKIELNADWLSLYVLPYEFETKKGKKILIPEKWKENAPPQERIS